MFKKFLEFLKPFYVDPITKKLNLKNITITAVVLYFLSEATFSEYGVFEYYYTKWSHTDGDDTKLLPTLLLRFNVLYVSILAVHTKLTIIDIIYNSVISFFIDVSKDLDLDYFRFNQLWNQKATENPKHLLIYYYAKHSLWWEHYKLTVYNEHWKKIFLRFSNLPVFFYFGCMFILSTISSIFLLSYYGFYGVYMFNLITILFFWISTIFYFDRFFIDNVTYKINLGKWFVINFIYVVNFEICIDPISFAFMFLTLTIAVFVYIYAFSYFRYEPNVERLILLINMFVISMICLVTSGNLFVMFLGWELIGLTSFFLINFWSTRISTLKAAFKAFVFNKFSDVSILIAILLMYFCFGEINILSISNQVSLYNNTFITINTYKLPIIEVISFFLITSAFIKSAQFGFHVWLPDSMEAPVPASALIHSATLVSAGVFLLLKFSHLFEFSMYSYYIVPIIGSFTAFFGGLCSSYQSDIKKILAYSTISHCGFLMVCYSTYICEYTILYLYIHGFFKAAVFLCVGNIIRFSRNYQDFRRMGMYWKYLPFECLASFICLINLCGLPFSIGFYIKHLLLIGIHMNNLYLYFILTNILGGAVFGLIYSYRLFYYVFFDFKKAKKIVYMQSNRASLFSGFYSNTTLASNISILLLIIVSYIVSIYMFHIFLNTSSYGEGLDIYSVRPSQYEEFNHPILTTISNIGYFNWLLLIAILCILFFTWRLVNKGEIILNIFWCLTSFVIFFYIFYNILV